MGSNSMISGQAGGVAAPPLPPDSARSKLKEQDSLLQEMDETINLLEQRLAVLDPNYGSPKADVGGQTAAASTLSELANRVDRHNDSIRSMIVRLDKLSTTILNNL